VKAPRKIRQKELAENYIFTIRNQSKATINAMPVALNDLWNIAMEDNLCRLTAGIGILVCEVLSGTRGRWFEASSE
jgi:hypothetical protein